MTFSRAWTRIALLVLIASAVACSTPPQKPVDAPEKEFKENPEKLDQGFKADLREVEYPFDLSEFVVQSQGQTLRMNYMHIRPTDKERGTIVLLHGKNFSGAYFRSLTVLLWKRGYRIIIPDQIGFGKSSKPEGYQFSFHEMARQTKLLIDHLDLKKVHLVGHSMGGMLATRFALMYPETVARLTLVNPIGLEDVKTSVPYRTIDELSAEEAASTPEKIRKYQTENYYGGQWKPAYEEWIQIPIGWINGPDIIRMSRIAAQTTEMIYTQPVVYEFAELKVPTTLVIGTRDRTAVGKAWTKPEVAAKLGDYRKLGRETVKKVRGAKLVEIDGVGHVPFIESLPKFWDAFSRTLN
jgi:pimeloyl-ACP methyl ester carboxylesterase